MPDTHGDLVRCSELLEKVLSLHPWPSGNVNLQGQLTKFRLQLSTGRCLGPFRSRRQCRCLQPVKFARQLCLRTIHLTLRLVGCSAGLLKFAAQLHEFGRKSFALVR